MKLVVVGGGVTALAAAHRAVELARERGVDLDLRVVEPRGRGALDGGDDESLGAFVRRRLGAEALARVAQPLVAGIYTADPEELSVAATMPRFVEVERRHRSLILGLRRGLAQVREPGTSGARFSLFVTFADGMEPLVTTLVDRLPDSAVELGHRVSAVKRQRALMR